MSTFIRTLQSYIVHAQRDLLGEQVHNQSPLVGDVYYSETSDILPLIGDELDMHHIHRYLPSIWTSICP